MGNFSVNHYSKIAIESDRIHIDYFIDLAEIPTYQELQQANIPTTAVDPNSAAVIGYVLAGCGTWPWSCSRSGWKNRSASPYLQWSHLSCRAGGLPTMKMGFVYEATYPSASSIADRQNVSLHYADNNYPDIQDGRRSLRLHLRFAAPQHSPGHRPKRRIE